MKTVTGEDVSFEDLGGASAHATKSGVAHLVAPDEQACIDDARYLLTFLPQNNLESAPYAAPTDPVERESPDLDTLIPDSPNKPYDIKRVIEAVVDDGDFLELQPRHAENIVCGFARLGGHSIGVVGNQPAALAGVLDIDASVKAARFVRTCDAFNVPLVTFVDVPGFLPGTAQEWGGIIRHGAKLLYAYAEATVPKLTVITRKAYGGAYDVMMIVRGVNVFPSQIEEQILRTPGLTPHYLCVLERPGRLDTLTVRVEAASDTWGEGVEGRGVELAERVKAAVGVTIEVDVVSPGAIERSQGKARRIDDRRA